ncbi:MAG: hypothetical protein MUE58_11600 [Chitinophagaceae bacterium]|jgi:hypothetical protein|nr:hypothetical protein [Chitinophagaceae bacterium]
MKPILKTFVIAMIALATITSDVYAQGGPPPWAPAKGYRAKARYTYFPTLGFYFDTRVGVYFFLEAGIWTRRTTLPERYRNYNWKNYRYEEFDWASNEPWEKHNGKGKDKDKSSNGNSRGNGNGHGKGKGR